MSGRIVTVNKKMRVCSNCGVEITIDKRLFSKGRAKKN